MKPESALLRAARVFNFSACADHDDDLVGQIRGTKIYASELRRLNQAIEQEDNRRAEPDPADDGPEIALINFFLANPQGVHWGHAPMNFRIKNWFTDGFTNIRWE
jgi:hypothetical protein